MRLLAREIRCGQLDGDDVENAYEMHFVINVDNANALGLSGDEVVEWAGFFQLERA